MEYLFFLCFWRARDGMLMPQLGKRMGCRFGWRFVFLALSASHVAMCMLCRRMVCCGCCLTLFCCAGFWGAMKRGWMRCGGFHEMPPGSPSSDGGRIGSVLSALMGVRGGKRAGGFVRTHRRLGGHRSFVQYTVYTGNSPWRRRSGWAVSHSFCARFISPPPPFAPCVGLSEQKQSCQLRQPKGYLPVGHSLARGSPTSAVCAYRFPFRHRARPVPSSTTAQRARNFTNPFPEPPPALPISPALRISAGIG
jgi:hypothetical protein